MALFAAISNHLLHNKGQLLLGCRATDLVSIAWAYTHMGHTSHKLLATIARTLPARALRLEPPDASRVLWAYAVAGQVHRRMLTAVTEAVEGRMHLATPRVAASAVWSLAKLSFPAPAFVEAALDLIASCMEGAGGGWHGSQQQECLQPWEHEGQRQQPQEWQQPQQQQGGLHDAPSISDGALRSNSSSNGANMVQQALPGSTSGLVKASRQSSGTNSNGSGGNNSSNGTSILQQLYTGPPPSQHTASPRDVEQAVWAAGRLKHFNGALVAAVKRRLPALLPGMSDVGVVNVLWGFARLGYYSAAIVDPLCLEVSRSFVYTCSAAVCTVCCCLKHIIGAADSLNELTCSHTRCNKLEVACLIVQRQITSNYVNTVDGPDGQPVSCSQCMRAFTLYLLFAGLATAPQAESPECRHPGTLPSQPPPL